MKNIVGVLLGVGFGFVMGLAVLDSVSYPALLNIAAQESTTPPPSMTMPPTTIPSGCFSYPPEMSVECPGVPPPPAGPICQTQNWYQPLPNTYYCPVSQGARFSFSATTCHSATSYGAVICLPGIQGTYDSQAACITAGVNVSTSAFCGIESWSLDCTTNPPSCIHHNGSTSVGNFTSLTMCQSMFPTCTTQERFVPNCPSLDCIAISNPNDPRYATAALTKEACDQTVQCEEICCNSETDRCETVQP